MKSFQGMAGTAGVHPQVTAKDDTAPGAYDGTALLAQWVQEILGSFQAVLNGAAITPSGTAETCGIALGNLVGSQLAEAIQLIAGYPGEIFAYPCPTGALTLPTGMRALKLEGQTILLTDYPRLTAAVYCGDAANGTAGAFYKTSDTPGTIRAIGGAYMVLPDMRGQFIRGSDLAAAVDPDGASRTAGDIQAADINEHSHAKLYETGGASEILSYTEQVGTGAANAQCGIGGSEDLYTGLTGTGIGDETRPTNVSITWCIRF